ncbi:MAG: right-handed parallel beta-helix repeat-containing protein [Elusimicrobiota bacterium]
MNKVNQQAIDKVISGKVEVAQAIWWGFNPEDATNALQSAINSGAKKIIVDNAGKPWIVRPIKLVGNQEILFEKGVEVVAKRGEFKGKTDCLFRADNQDNIILTGYGATLRMNRGDYKLPDYEKAEWRHVLSFFSCSNIKIYGLTLAESGGDGIYLGVAKKGVTNKDVHIKDVVSENNYRQGISVISAQNLLIENTIMRYTAGAAPQAGIDFEPNNSDELLDNILLRNCTAESNKSYGYLFALKEMGADTKPISIRIEDCKAVGDTKGSLRFLTGNISSETVKGIVEFINCTFESGKSYGVLIEDKPVTGCKLRFVNCSILNKISDKPAASIPIKFHSRPGSTEPIGGVEFVNCVINDTLDRNPVSYPNSAKGVPLREVEGTLTINLSGGRQKQLTLQR